MALWRGSRERKVSMQCSGSRPYSDPRKITVIAVLASVGTILFVGSGVAQVSVSKVIRPLLAFIGIMLLVLLLVIYVPEISLFLPSLFGL